MIYDITSFDSTKKSLAELLDLAEWKIEEFVFLESTNLLEFLGKFDITDKKLLEKDIELVSIHNTTTNDECLSLKEKGIINLQAAVIEDTPLKRYLSKKDVHIDVKNKFILYKGKKYDISEKNVPRGSYFLSAKETYKNDVIRKFYEDFQINGFLCHENILTYGGYTRYRPEILLDLGHYLQDSSIETDWVNDKSNKSYVVKYKQPLHNYKYFTFPADNVDADFGLTIDMFDILSKDEINVMAIKWLINKSLTNIRYDVSESASYVNPELKIDPEDILDIMTEQEYLDIYQIKNFKSR